MNDFYDRCLDEIGFPPNSVQIEVYSEMRREIDKKCGQEPDIHNPKNDKLVS